MPRNRLLVVNVAALGWDLVDRAPPPGFSFRRAETVFPAVTCVAQASFRTAEPPSRHGLVANGLWFDDLKKVLFWEQSAALVAGRRIWRRLRERGKRVGLLFWQQSLGEAVDLVLSPRPIHKHEGGMIQDCYSQPPDLYARLCAHVGRPFNLMHYWGPLASRKSSEWIAAATRAVMETPDLAPDLLLTYLPHLDYDLQRRGPNARPAAEARDVLYRLLADVRASAEACGYDWIILGDYAMEAVSQPAVFPNRALRDAGLFTARTVKGMAYPDFFNSRAFAVVDHQVAHVYAPAPEALSAARDVLAALPGVEAVLDREEQSALGIDHRRSGDLVLVAGQGGWFAYPWWTDRREAPDYATHIDIHNKPGYDPCELFFGWPPLSVSTDTAKVKGSHGRVDAATSVAWATSLDIPGELRSLLEIARAARDWCDRGR